MDLIARRRPLLSCLCRSAMLFVSAVGMMAAEAAKRSALPSPSWMTAPELQAFSERRKAIGRRMMTASNAESQDAGGYLLSNLGSREAIHRRRDLLREYREAWAEWSEATRGSDEDRIRRELERQSVAPERMAEILESYRRTQAVVRKATVGLPEGPPLETYFALKGELLDLVESNLGAWRIDAKGDVVITNDDFRRRFAALGARMRAYGEQAQARTAAIEARAEAARERLKAKQASSSEGTPASR